jgi:hypothetical protein
MKTIRLGDSGAEVRTLQDALNCAPVGASRVTVDGEFGPNTLEAVLRFQQAIGLYDDGIVGPNTWDRLGVPNGLCKPEPKPEGKPCNKWVKVPADEYGGGYDSHTLRDDIAPMYKNLLARVNGVGALLTSSGSKRALSANVSSNRSATSLHYVGRALDLFVYSGMNHPEADPYVVTKDLEQPGYWIVWARCNLHAGKLLTLDAWDHSVQATVRVTGNFVNLTEIMAEHGFERIKARKSYAKANYGAAEWWHFQNTRGLVPGVTTFGEELDKLYTHRELIDTPPFKSRNAVWQKDWH